MDSYLESVNEILNELLESKQQGNELISNFEKRFQRLAQKFYPSKEKELAVQQQTKKKLKGRNGSHAETSSADDTNTSSAPSVPNSFMQQSSVEEIPEADTTYQRPVRTARPKLDSLKEPALNTKMRREEAIKLVKAERISTEAAAPLPDVQATVENGTSSGYASGSVSNYAASIASTSSAIGRPTSVASTTSAISAVSSATSTNTIVSAATNNIIIPMPMVRVKLEKLSMVNGVVETSANKYTSAAQTAANKRKSIDVEPNDDADKSSAASKKVKSNDSVEIIPNEVNMLEVSDDEEVNDNERSIMPPPTVVPPQAAIRTNKKSNVNKKTDTNAKPIRSTRSKQVAQSTTVKVKEEPIDPVNDAEVPIQKPVKVSRSISSATSSTSNGNKTQKDKAKTSRQMSGESVYEDAVSDSNKNSQTTFSIEPLEGNVSATVAGPMDATFVTTTTENVAEFLSPRPTYVISKEGKSTRDATFHVAKEPQIAAKPSKSNKNKENVVTKQKTKVSAASSIMTEDDSDSGSPVQPVFNNFKQPHPLKTGKEIFSPYAHKSTKQKIEMFEKLQSPILQRQTRTKTRAQQTPNDEDGPSKSSKGLTATVDQQKTLRTNSATRYNTTSKHPNHTLLIKSQSVDDIRKQQLAAVADEKKKKRDDKLQKAQMAREAQAKERMEKHIKQVQEKEQRLKETQQKKLADEMVKMQELKRREAEREQSRKEQQAAAARKERDNFRILAEQKVMQDKLRANQRAQELQKQRLQANAAYNFDMLDSGDSTDCEEKDSRKRPPAPEWSLKENRLPLIVQEATVDQNIVDEFFSVEPRVVDLREIFPKIDDRYLRRNSSAVWNTPPRYSMMPKY